MPPLLPPVPPPLDKAVMSGFRRYVSVYPLK